MATRTKTLRKRWSLEAAEEISKVVGNVEEVVMRMLKGLFARWHSDQDAYEAYDDLQ